MIISLAKEFAAVVFEMPDQVDSLFSPNLRAFCYLSR